MLKIETLPPIESARVAVFNSAGEVLLVQRDDSGELPNMWEIPGGKPNKGESFEQAGIRETREETGVEAVLLSRPVLVPERPILDGKHAGRLIRAVGMKALMRLPFDTPVALSETRQVRWVAPNEIGNFSLTPTSRDTLQHLQLL